MFKHLPGLFVRVIIFVMYLATNIKYLRKLHKFTQNDLVRELGGYRSSSSVQKWETGQADPPLDVVINLAKLFNVSVDDLLNVDLATSILPPLDREIISRYHSSPEDIKSIVKCALHI